MKKQKNAQHYNKNIGSHKMHFKICEYCVSLSQYHQILLPIQYDSFMLKQEIPGISSIHYRVTALYMLASFSLTNTEQLVCARHTNKASIIITNQRSNFGDLRAQRDKAVQETCFPWDGISSLGGCIGSGKSSEVVMSDLIEQELALKGRAGNNVG